MISAVWKRPSRRNRSATTHSNGIGPLRARRPRTREPGSTSGCTTTVARADALASSTSLALRAPSRTARRRRVRRAAPAPTGRRPPRRARRRPARPAPSRDRRRRCRSTPSCRRAGRRAAPARRTWTRRCRARRRWRARGSRAPREALVRERVGGGERRLADPQHGEVLFVDQRGQPRRAVERERQQPLARLHDVAGLDAAVEHDAGRRRERCASARASPPRPRAPRAPARAGPRAAAFGARPAGSRSRARGGLELARATATARRASSTRASPMKPCAGRAAPAARVALGDAQVRLGLREELARVRRPDIAPLQDPRLRRASVARACASAAASSACSSSTSTAPAATCSPSSTVTACDAAGDRRADVGLGRREHAAR